MIALLALLGCGDGDGDGFGRRDCNDGVAGVNPDAVEVCFNGLDDDCDGLVDDDADDAGTWYADADADGAGDPAALVRACIRPDGHVPSAGDCDDGDAGVGPRAPEVCNAADEDCDGLVDEDLDLSFVYVDADGDGWGGALTGDTVCAELLPAGTAGRGGDCDDNDASVNPEATDTPYDGVDANCQGDDDFDADVDGHGSVEWGGDDCDDADPDINPGEIENLLLPGDEDCAADRVRLGAWFRGLSHPGRAMAAVGDQTGDGLPDLVVSNTHTEAVYLLTGDTASGLLESVHTARLTGETEFGTSLAGVGDVTGNGWPDVWIGEPETPGNPGRAWLYEGPITSASEAVLVIGGTTDLLGLAVAGISDQDGDGRPDLAAAQKDEIVVWTAGVVGEASAADAAGTVAAPGYDPSLATGDVDGDGVDDIVVGSGDLAEAAVYAGPVLGPFAWDDAASVLEVPAYDSIDVAATDLDGDGYADVVVGSWAADTVLVWRGPLVARATPSDAIATLTGAESSHAGWAVAAAGDLDGDGFADLLVGAPTEGAGYIVFGPVEGAIALAAGGSPRAQAMIANLSPPYGYSVAGLGDVDGDGFDDAAIAGHKLNRDDSGVRLVLGGPP